MNAKTCLEKLRLVGILAVATVDASGAPQVRDISAIHFEPDSLEFFTARGKDFCHELERDSRVQALGYTRSKEMIRLSGHAFELRGDERAATIETIFSEQPYLANVYPGETRAIGTAFRIAGFDIEYFNLGTRPIHRQCFSVSADGLERVVAPKKGYRITEACIGCGMCRGVCPEGCIGEGGPCTIDPEHCLRCGACYEVCPVGAVERITGAG